MDFLTSADNDLSSLVLSVLFSSVGSYLAVDFMSRTHKGNSVSRLNWLFIVAIIYGSSAWASQVLTVQSVKASFVPGAMFFALIAILAFSIVGFAIALRRARWAGVEIGGAVIGLGNVVGLNLVAVAAGASIPLPVGFDQTASTYMVSISLSVIAFSVAVRTERRVTHAAAALIMVISSGALVFGTEPGGYDAAHIAGAVAGRDIILPSVVVIMSAVLSTALATYNIQNQSRIEAIRALKDLSVIDSLTGLNNRDALKRHVSELIATVDHTTAKFVVVAFNLNRFRMINDVHGSEAGDHMLKTVSSRLMASLGPNEFIARASGDEFYAVKAGIHRRADAVAFADKLIEIVREPIQWNGSKLDITARIGGAIFPHNSEKADELLGQADIAMCRAGATHAEEVVFFDSSIDKAKRNLNALAIDLRKAIDEGEFEIYYQPQHSAINRTLIGFEALIRWNHPLKGMVSPADFIPLAEKTGMINEIGAWVIRESCLQAARWDSSIKVAVNVSANQIMRNDLPEIVQDALSRSGIDPRRLELEITESGIVNDERHALSILTRLKSLGCSVAMDDFGTGFSSLSMFKKFPFDKIKIDRAFISDLATNKQSHAIVNAAVGVGRPLGIKVLAEGVEDEEQMSILTDLECDEVQGFFFGRPVPAHEADAILRTARLSPSVASYSTGKIVEFKAKA
nr:EAL domain-containing protein [Neorhizobium tomejilense]